MSKKKILFTVLRTLVFALLFVFLIVPRWNPFLDEDTRAVLTNELRRAFGVLTDDTTSAIFSPSRIFTALAVALFVYLLSFLVCHLIELLLSHKRRSKTVAGLVTSIFKVIAAIAGIVWVLSVLGVNLTAIFASLGVASLILGFGVQSLIEDCVTGIFLIIEGQYNIGDIIVLENFRGTVERISMRTTTLRDDGGNLKIVNNSDIRNIQNRSSKTSVAVCDIGIGYDEDLIRVEQILSAAFPVIYEENRDVFASPPRYAGVQSLGASAVLLRVAVDVAEKQFFPATRRLNRALKLLFDQNGISIPYNQLVVHNGKED